MKYSLFFTFLSSQLICERLGISRQSFHRYLKSLSDTKYFRIYRHDECMERYMFTRQPQRRVRVDYYCLPFVLAVAYKANTPEAEAFITAV